VSAIQPELLGHSLGTQVPHRGGPASEQQHGYAGVEYVVPGRSRDGSRGPRKLFITHELDGLDQVGHIVVLDHGQVAEQGSHRQLRHAGGHYQRMREADYDSDC
jgi:hypothetical protein